MANERLTTLDLADLVREVANIRDACDRVLEILLPESGSASCPHPRDQIVDNSTMDAEEYVCRRCGTTQDQPFHQEN